MPLPSRLDIPLVPNPNNACSLCCMTMVSSYFFPKQYDFESIGRIAKYKPGFVVWVFPFFSWFLEQGGQISFWDNIDYQKWVAQGFESLAEDIPEQEFVYFKKTTFDPDSLREDIKKTLCHERFSFHQEKPNFEELKRRTKEGELCTVVLNGSALLKQDGLDLHQVLVLDVSESEVIFHNPFAGERAQAAQKETIEFFCHAWLESTECPDMTAYRL